MMLRERGVEYIEVMDLDPFSQSVSPRRRCASSTSFAALPANGQSDDSPQAPAALANNQHLTAAR
jgi:hypothetical protein